MTKPAIRATLLALSIVALVSLAPARTHAQPPAGFPNVVPALRAAPGCLGVQLAQTPDGRRIIFAWFDGKKALVDWYYSEPHQSAMRAVYPDITFEQNPLPHLADDAGPILTIVSVKFADDPKPDIGPRPIAGRAAAPVSIGIELYGPLPGGIALGGTFAPAAVKVPGLRRVGDGGS